MGPDHPFRLRHVFRLVADQLRSAQGLGRAAASAAVRNMLLWAQAITSQIQVCHPPAWLGR
jgi:hypothetical protein